MTAEKKDMENTKADAIGNESIALFGLVADIRAAVGDPTGKLMQDELVARCRKMRDVLIFVRDECGGDERIGPAITAALDWPNKKE